MDFFSFYFWRGKSKFVDTGFFHISSLLNQIILAPQLDSIGLSLCSPLNGGENFGFFSFYFWRGKSTFVETGFHISSLLNQIILAPQLGSIGLSLCSPLNDGENFGFFHFISGWGKSKFVETGVSHLFSFEPNHTSTSTWQHWSLSLFTPKSWGKLWIFSFYFWMG